MSQTFNAVFENGVLRPLEPLSLQENQLCTVTVVLRAESNPYDPAIVLARQRQTLADMFAEAEAMPLEVADDGFSGADHDLVLYGWKQQ